MQPLTSATILANEASLEAVLCSAGAHFWSHEQIKAHMKFEQAKAPSPSLLWHLRPINRFFLFNGKMGAKVFFSFAGLSAFTLILAYSLLGMQVLNTLPAHVAKDAALLYALTGLIFLSLHMLAWKLGEIEVRPPAMWCWDWFDEYEDTLPQKAKEIADAVQALKPGANILVYSLLQGKEVLDPILAVEDDSGIYYALVWDADGNVIEPH